MVYYCPDSVVIQAYFYLHTVKLKLGSHRTKDTPQSVRNTHFTALRCSIASFKIQLQPFFY